MSTRVSPIVVIYALWCGACLCNLVLFCLHRIKILEEFFYHFNGPEWKQNDYWLDDQYSYCDWYGVSCDALNVSTTKLELGSNGLSGELNIRIIEKLSGLKKLETLDLSGNDITG